MPGQCDHHGCQNDQEYIWAHEFIPVTVTCNRRFADRNGKSVELMMDEK